MDIRESYDCDGNLPRHFWEIARFEFVKKLIFKTVPSPQNVIDIGCGDCFVLQSLAELFPASEFTGIDTALTEDMIKKLTSGSNHHGNMTLCRDLKHKLAGKADLILLLDVLEHIEDEKIFLRNLHDLLHQNSKIIITVPAFQKLFTDHDRFLKHHRRYNRKELLKVLEYSGLKVTYSGYIFCTLLPFRILQKLFGVKSAKQNSLRAGNKFINRISAAILQTDAAITSGLSFKKIYIPGLSCFAVAELKSDN